MWDLYESTHCDEPDAFYGIQKSLIVVEISNFEFFENIRVYMEKMAKIIYFSSISRKSLKSKLLFVEMSWKPHFWTRASKK